ncbi:MAG: alpha/beta hydrolase family protein, partial [Armatimonadota bacterium]
MKRSDSVPWLARLLPTTTRPNQSNRRLVVNGYREFDAKGTRAGWVDFEFRFPGLDGKGETAVGRLYVPGTLAYRARSTVPYLHNAGYELDPGAAAGWVSRGYAVSTVVGHPLNPLGRGDLLDRCMVHGMRTLPFLDLERMAIAGGSAGGWMTLMVAADAFPVLWSNPDVPVLNWPYNGDYIERNRARAGTLGSDGKPSCPFLSAVGQLADQVKSVFAMPWTSPEWLALTPLAQLDAITAPVLAVFTTADMLVPIDQVDAKWVRKFDASRFPGGFSTDVNPAVPVPGRGPRLVDNLPRS